MSLNNNYNNEMKVECIPGPRNACGPWKVSEDATLLPPDDEKGIEVFTEIGYFGIHKNYKGNTPEKGGLKSSEQIYKEVNKNYKLIPSNNEFNDQKQVIYFRPSIYRFPLKEGKIPTFEELFPIDKDYEYKSFTSRGEYEKYVDTLNIKNIIEKKTLLDRKPMFTIKVDPENTYIYNQNWRLIGSWMGRKKINARVRYDECRMKLSDYMNAQFEYEKAKKTLDDIYSKHSDYKKIGELYKETYVSINQYCGVDDDVDNKLKELYLRKKDSRKKDYEDAYEKTRLETIEALKKEILSELQTKTYEELKKEYRWKLCKDKILDFIIVKDKVDKIDGLEEAIINVWKADKNYKDRMCGAAIDNEIIIKTPLIGPEWFVKTNYYVVPKINSMKQEKAFASYIPNNNAMLIETSSSVAPKNIVLVAAPSKKSIKLVPSALKPAVLRTKDNIMKNIAILEANIASTYSVRQKEKKQDILKTLKAELDGMSGGKRKTRKHSKRHMRNRKTRRLQ